MRTREYQTALRSLTKTVAVLAASRWSGRDAWLDGGADQAALIVAAGQTRAAELATPYLAEVVGGGEQLVASAFGRTASDGRPLTGLMRGAAFAAPMKAAEAEVQRAAIAWLLMVAQTQVADAGRAALRTGMAVRDAGGVRIAASPCCPRCAVLHGRYYPWKADFLRHPRCGCTFEPVRRGEAVPDVGDVPLDQITGLSKADREAIELGADRNRVINAHRGMYTATVHGEKVKATLDSTRARTSAFPARVNPRTVRLRPESILAHAKDSEDAIRLLHRYGYIR